MNRPPKLRADLVMRKMSSHGETYIILKDPETQEYYKYEEWEHDLFELLDGGRGLRELCCDFDAIHPERGVDPQWMVDYIEGLRMTGLLERTDQEKHLVMMDKLKTLRKRKLYEVESIFKISVPLFDPDRLMDRVIPWIRWVWSPAHVALWLLIFAAVLGFLVYNWSLYWTGLFALVDPATTTLWSVIALFGLIFTVSIWHELGHGFTCKRLGGEVHDIGFMFFYFEPAFYCSIDDSYLFPRLSHRIYCALGGGYFELMLCSVAMAVWLLTPAEWFVHGVAMTLVFITGLSVLFNFNPLLKFDGYYALMDWLDVPELREESFRYISQLFKRHVFHLSVADTPVSRRRRRIYMVYGIFSMLYTALILLVFFGIVRDKIVGWLGPLGYLVLFGLALLLMRRKLAAAGRFVRHVWLDKREWLRSARRRAVVGAAIVLVILLLFVPRSPTRIGAAFNVEPAARSEVRAPADAVIRRVDIVEGMEVEAGQLVGLLEDPDLEARGRIAAADLERLLREAAEARLGQDIVAASTRTDEATEAAFRVRLVERTLGELSLTAPIAGVVTTPDRVLDSSPGRFLAQGETFCTIDRIDTVRLAVSTLESDIGEIHEGAEVRLLAAALPGRTLRANVLALSPVAVPPSPEERDALDLVQRVNLVRVLVEVDNPDRRLLPGMSGRVQFLTRPRSPAGKVWWRFRRWAGTVVW